MDIATIVGILIGIGSIVGGILIMPPDLAMFGSFSGFAIVFGGMIASVSVAFPLQDVLKLGAAMAAVFKGSKEKEDWHNSCIALFHMLLVCPFVLFVLCCSLFDSRLTVF